MVFELDKERIAQCFRRSLTTYDDAAVVQRNLAEKLIQYINTLPDEAFNRVLEIGCCTGSLSEMLCNEKSVGTLYLNDLVSEFESGVLRRLSKYETTDFISCFGDIETLALPSNISLVLSGATFQWLSDFPAFITKLGRVLQPGSYLAFSMFGPGTLKEFSSLISVELKYHEDAEILAVLDKDFVVESFHGSDEKLFFSSVREISSHIRATGVGGVSEYQWNKESLKLFEGRYHNEFGTQKGLPVSYSSLSYVVRRR